MEAGKKAKKQRRKEALFLKKEADLGVTFQDSPSPQVLVSNGGLGNGIPRALLEQVLCTHQLYMPADKDYAFAVFSSVSQAEQVIRKWNGVCVQSLSDTSHLLPPCVASGPPLHLFLSYITTLPQSVLAALCTPAPSTPPLPSLPSGLTLIRSFVTPDQEEELMAFLDSTHTSHSHLKHRQVVHYGYEFDYRTNNVDIGRPLPGGFPQLIQHLISKIGSCGHVHNSPDQLTVNHYPPGAGIPPHVDTHSAFLDDISSLSLGSQVVMDFRRVSAAGVVTEKVPVLLPARSLLVMSGEARYLWTHGIATRHYDQVPAQQDEAAVAMTAVPRQTRVSLTFRTVRKPPGICTCDFPLHCDSHSSNA